MSYSPPLPPPPQLAGASFCYREDRRYEPELAEMRDTQPPPNVYSLYDGKGFFNSSGQPLFGPWTAPTTRAFVLHPSRRAAAVHVTHPPPWPPLYGWEPMVECPPMTSLPCFHAFDTRGFSEGGLDFSPDGRMLSNIEWLRTGALCLYDVATGGRTFLTTVDHIAGSEIAKWSTDGRWLLITSSTPRLVAPFEGIIIDLEFEEYTQVDWWPARGTSSLFLLVGSGEGQRVECLDLSSNTRTAVGTVLLHRQDDLPPDRHLIANPHVSPDGKHVLVGSPLGPPGEYQLAVGSRRRWAILDLTTMQVVHHVPAWFDPGAWVERDHERWRWFDRAPYAGEVVVHASFRERSRGFVGPDPALDLFNPTAKDESVLLWSW